MNRHAQLFGTFQQSLAEQQHIARTAIVIGLIVTQKHSAPMPLGIQAIHSHTTSRGKIDIDTGTAFMLCRVTDGHTGFGI